MIDAYKAGVPRNGLPFPDGSKIAKIEWKLKKSTEPSFFRERAGHLARHLLNREGYPEISGSEGVGLRPL